MRHQGLIGLAGACAILMLAGSALGSAPATTMTVLDVRMGPGGQYPVVGVIRAGTRVSIEECAQASKWCSIRASDMSGWVNSDYLLADLSSIRVALRDLDGPSVSG